MARFVFDLTASMISLIVIYALWCFFVFSAFAVIFCLLPNSPVSLLVIRILLSCCLYGWEVFIRVPQGFLSLCVFLFLEFSDSLDTLIHSDLQSPGTSSVFGSRASFNIIFPLCRLAVYLTFLFHILSLWPERIEDMLFFFTVWYASYFELMMCFILWFCTVIFFMC